MNAGNGEVTGPVRETPGPQAALFQHDTLTAVADRLNSARYVNIAAAIEDGEIRLVLRSIVEMRRPLEIALTADDADQLARALHGHAAYLDPHLHRRGPL